MHLMMGGALERSTLALVGVADDRHEQGVQVVGSALAEVPGQQIQQLLQIAIQRSVQRVLDAEIHPDAAALGSSVAECDLLHEGERNVGASDVFFDRDLAQKTLDGLESSAMRGE